MKKCNTLIRAEGKIKQLNEALELCDKIAMQAQWAQDFASFTLIQECMERILEVVGEVEQDLNRELDYVNYQVDDYELKLQQFEVENSF
jgi:predicted transglutaminase-like cysteine proteinase